MTPTANELILIAMPWLVMLMACLTVYYSYRDLIRRRTARQAASINSHEPAGHVWIRLTADESAIVRNLLEKDLQEKTGDDRPTVSSSRMAAGRG